MHEVPVDALPSGLIEIDDAGCIVAVNALVREWAGTDCSEYLGQPLASLLRPPPATRTDALEYLPAIAEIIPPDESRFPVLVAGGSPGSNGHAYLTLFDARAQRAFREKLQSRHSLVERTQTRLELVISASIAFAEAADEEQLAAVLADTTARAYSAEEAVVFLLDDDLVYRHAAGHNPFDAIPDADALVAQALGLRQVMKIVGRDEADAVAPSVGRAFEKAGVHSMIIAPIHQRNQPLGILAAFFHHPRQFDEQASPLADALAGQAARAIAALRLQSRLEHEALHDETTGLPNRRFLEERTEVSDRSAGDIVAVLFVDLDGFKAVNDELGHHVGDELLRVVGQRLQSAVRERDVVARYGGDEFVIVCEVSGEAAAKQMAERIQETIRAPYSILPADQQIGASIGVSLGPAGSPMTDTDRLVRSADQAMYLAKSEGGNRIVTAAAAAARKQ